MWIYEVDRKGRSVTFHARNGDHSVEMPLDPMHGTVGLAPASFEARSSLVPESHGGNMDTPEMRAGVTCFLGVNVEGALFSIGDGHCRQGEGEVCGVAVEAAMDTVVVVDVIKGTPTPWPRLESDAHLMSTGSARPLEDAFRISQHGLIQWLVTEYGMEQLDAYQLISQVSEAPVANVCDPNYTFVSKIGKQYLPGGSVHTAAPTRGSARWAAPTWRAPLASCEGSRRAGAATPRWTMPTVSRSSTSTGGSGATATSSRATT